MSFIRLILQTSIIAWLFSCPMIYSLQHTYDLSNRSIDWHNIHNQMDIASSCTYLDLSYNNLNGVIPNGAFNLFKLVEKLGLKENKMTALNEHSFYYHPEINSSYLNESWRAWKPLKLVSLDLSYNLFEILTPNWLNEIISTLKYLDISHNKIREISESFLHASEFKFFQIDASNNPLDCMELVWLRHVSTTHLNLTCYVYKFHLRHKIVNVPISDNSSNLETNSFTYPHDLFIKSIPIQDFKPEYYFFQTNSIKSKFELTCIYQGDNWPIIVWLHGQKSIKKSLDPKLFQIIETKGEHGGITSTLMGSTENFDINLTCKFLRHKEKNELDRVSFNIRKKDTNDSEHGLLNMTIMPLQNEASSFLSFVSVFSNVYLFFLLNFALKFEV